MKPISRKLRVPTRRQTTVTRKRLGSASLELVMLTAVAVPLGILLFLLGVQLCRYVFRGLSGMLTMPFL